MDGWLVVGLVASLVYLVSCAIFPYKPCPTCSDNKLRWSGKGHYRLRRCWRCHGQPYPRVGTRLIGLARRD